MRALVLISRNMVFEHVIQSNEIIFVSRHYYFLLLAQRLGGIRVSHGRLWIIRFDLRYVPFFARSVRVQHPWVHISLQKCLCFDIRIRLNCVHFITEGTADSLLNEFGVGCIKMSRTDFFYCTCMFWNLWRLVASIFLTPIELVVGKGRSKDNLGFWFCFLRKLFCLMTSVRAWNFLWWINFESIIRLDLFLTSIEMLWHRWNLFRQINRFHFHWVGIRCCSSLLLDFFFQCIAFDEFNGLFPFKLNFKMLRVRNLSFLFIRGLNAAWIEADLTIFILALNFAFNALFFGPFPYWADGRLAL